MSGRLLVMSVLAGGVLPVFACKWLSSRHLVGAYVSGLIGIVTVMVALASAFDFPASATVLVPLSGTVVAALLARWLPGWPATIAVAGMVFITGGEWLDSQSLSQDTLFVAYAMWFVVLGATGSLLLPRILPPPVLTCVLGLVSWLLGTAYLIGTPTVEWRTAALAAGWSSLVLLVLSALWKVGMSASPLWAAAGVAASLLVVADIAEATRMPGLLLLVVVLAVDVVVLGALYRRSRARADLP